MRTDAAARRRERQDQPQVRGSDSPAPVGGWNAKDPIAAMPREDAVLLDNWIPRPGYVEIRRGFLAHVQATDFERATEAGDVRVTEDGEIRVTEASDTATLDVESLLVWRGGTEDADKMFAVAGGEIYDVTTAGTLDAALVTGLTSNRVESVNYANDAGHFLLAFTGSDTPKKFNGTAWSDNTITGSAGSLTLTPSTLVDCAVHKRRVFMVENNTLRVWFLETEAISGATGLLDTGPVFDAGGVIIFIGTWTIDGGQGADDMLVLGTNQGQVAIYQGIDPTDANNWSLVGVYEIGAPLGRRSLLKYGAELVVLTSDGAIPLSQALKLNRAQQKNIAITAKIQNAFAVAARSYGGNNGWEGILYPAGQLALFNVPITSGGQAHQYVQNVQTGAWCRFTGINAQCWAYANGNLYFGAADGVYHWDTGGSDNGTAITCDLTTAFQGFGSPHKLKQFTMLRPILRVTQSVAPAIDMLTDYRTGIPMNTPGHSSIVSSGVWGSGRWGTAVWTSSQPLRLEWTSVTGVGYVGAARMRFVSNPTLVSSVYPEVKAQLIGFDLMYIPGGML